MESSSTRTSPSAAGRYNWLFSMAELHRWHHSRLLDEANTNYGRNLIVWDIVLGTRFLPLDREPPEEIGIADMPKFPMGFIEQLLSPFTWARIPGDEAFESGVRSEGFEQGVEGGPALAVRFEFIEPRLVTESVGENLAQFSITHRLRFEIDHVPDRLPKPRPEVGKRIPGLGACAGEIVNDHNLPPETTFPTSYIIAIGAAGERHEFSMRIPLRQALQPFRRILPTQKYPWLKAENALVDQPKKLARVLEPLGRVRIYNDLRHCIYCDDPVMVDPNG